jgi:hypothetical protein
VGGVVRKGIDFFLSVVVVDCVGFEGAVGIIVQDTSARSMDVDNGLATIGFLLHALQDCLHAGQVVGGSGVEDDIVLGHVLGDEFGIVEVADDCFGAGLLEAVCVFLAADKAGDFVAFCYEEVEDGPAD